MGENAVDLKRRMDERFDDVDRRFGEVDKRMDERFARVDERFEEVGEHLGRMNGDIRGLRVAVSGMQRAMVFSVVAICTLMLTGFFALAGLIGS